MAGDPTVAVIGGGHDHLYPAANRGLAASIVRGGGVVVSEFAPDTEPSRGTFPRRNRIISGLADATVVVEAGVPERSADHGGLGARAGPRPAPRARPGR